jgi:multisubunit Na+/H+ antiporter MnhF subunit
MSAWLLASIVLSAGLMACALACLRCEPPAAVAALNVGSVVTVMLMVTLTEAFKRQPFIDLAVVLAPLGLLGSMVFVRFLERRD